jgi:hypothetical protein
VGAEDEETESEERSGDDLRLLTGGDSGENAARELLLRALGPGYNVTQVIDRDEGDSLMIATPNGIFIVRADRLRLSWAIRSPVDFERSYGAPPPGGWLGKPRKRRWWRKGRWSR